MRNKIKQACNFHLILLDIPSSLMLSVKNSGDVFLLSNNLFLEKPCILLQTTVTKKVKITMTNIIDQSKKINIYD